MKKEQFGAPEDVATLFAWANMRGAKYRDFSASRAKTRAEIRRRVEEAAEEERLRLMEQAQREAQEAAQRAAQEAAAQAEAIRRAEAERLAEIARQAESERQAVIAAQEAQHRAATQREHASASIPPPVTMPATMPVASGQDGMPHGSPITAPAADNYAEIVSMAAWTDDAVVGSPEASLESASRESASRESMREFSFPMDNRGTGNRSGFANPGIHPGMDENPFRASVTPESAPIGQRDAWDSPYIRASGSDTQPESSLLSTHPTQSVSESGAWSVPMISQPSARPTEAPRPVPSPTISQNFPANAEAISASMQDQGSYAVEDGEKPLLPSWLEELPHARMVAQSEPKAQAAPVPSAPLPSVHAAAPAPVHEEISWTSGAPIAFTAPATPIAAFPQDQQTYSPAAQHRDSFPYPAMHMPMAEVAAQPGMPRQDYPKSTEIRQPAMSAGTGYSLSAQDPLLASRERITRNWFALKSVFHPESAKPEQPQPRMPERVPALAVFSLAGGVGKTSLLASLARALSSRGEHVLLVDLSAYGLMPFFFGARDQKPGHLRTFSPPAATADAPIHLVTLDPERLKNEASGQDALVREIEQHASGVNRLLIDLPTASGECMRRVLRLNPTVLVPLMPDMNSVVSVGAIESFFQSLMAQSNAQSQPLYVLNHFDPAQQLHVDVRNLLREQIGNRLLPFVLRSSPAVSEALAEGMTVIDYAPGSVIAEDYLNLANWIRSLSAPAAVAQRGVRWSEQ